MNSQPCIFVKVPNQISEMITLRLKRSEQGKNRQEWSCESPTNSSLSEDADDRKCGQNMEAKRKYTKNTTGNKNEKCVETRKKRTKKCVSQLNESASELARKDEESICGESFVDDETPSTSSVRIGNRKYSSEIEVDLKEDSEKNVVENRADSVSTFGKSLFEAKHSNVIKDLLEDPLDSGTSSNSSFPDTNYVNAKNTECDISDGKIRKPSSRVCVQDSNSDSNSMTFLNPKTTTSINHCNGGILSINSNRSESFCCNLTGNNLSLLRNQSNSSGSAFNDEKVLQEISDEHHNRPTSSSKVSKCSKCINRFSAENIHKYAGASLTPAPVHVERFLPLNCGFSNAYDNKLRRSLSETAPNAFILPYINPQASMMNSGGRLFHHAGDTICRPIPKQLKENETMNLMPERTNRSASSPRKGRRYNKFWRDYHSRIYGNILASGTGSSASSTFAKSPSKSRRKRQGKISQSHARGFIAKSASDLHPHKEISTQPSRRLETTDHTVNQNPANSNNAVGLKPGVFFNFGGNPIYGHSLYSPINQMQQMVAMGVTPYCNLAGGLNPLVDPFARNTHVDLAHLPSSVAQSNLVDSCANRFLSDLLHFDNSKENRGKIFGCYVCRNFWTDSLHDLIQHASIDRSQPDDSVLMDGAYFKCTVCDLKVRNQSVMEAHRKGTIHKQRVDQKNHLKEGGLKSPFPLRGIVSLGCNVCFFYSDTLNSFVSHCNDPQHINNVKIKEFLNSFETKKEHYVCNTCSIAVMSKEQLYVHATSNEHKAAERRLLDAYGTRYLGGVCILKETYLNTESIGNLETNTVSSTNAGLKGNAEKTNIPSRSSPPRQKDASKVIQTVSVKEGSKDINPQQTDALFAEQRTAFCSPSNFSFLDPNLVHVKEFHGSGENIAKSSGGEIVPEKPFSFEKKQITDTLKAMHITTDAKQNTEGYTPEATCLPKRDTGLSELNSMTDDSAKMTVFSHATESNLYSTMQTSVGNIKEENTWASESAHCIPSTLHQNKHEDLTPLSARDIYSSSDSDSESSEIDVE